jgi:uroporphyrinogen decarboxylase
MNSYERIMKTMRLEEPDRVPISEFVIDPIVYKALLPNAKEQSEFEEAFDLDVVGARAFYAPVWEQGNLVKDEWGIIYQRNSEVVLHPVKGPLQEEGNFDLNAFTVPSSDDPKRVGRLAALKKQFKEKRAIGFHQRAFFLWATMIVGFDRLLMYLYEEPDFVHELFDKILECQISLAVTAIKGGADIIFETDDYAFNNGPLCSPAIFEEFIFPRLKKFVDAVHAHGAKMVKHTDGNVMKLLPGIIATGIDALHSIDPIAGMDLGEVKRLYGNQISLWGNVDCGSLLTSGTEQQVEDAVKECIRVAASGGGYVLQSSNSITSNTKPENFARMIKAGKEFGKYPIKL